MAAISNHHHHHTTAPSCLNPNANRGPLQSALDSGKIYECERASRRSLLYQVLYHNHVKNMPAKDRMLDRHILRIEDHLDDIQGKLDSGMLPVYISQIDLDFLGDLIHQFWDDLPQGHAYTRTIQQYECRYNNFVTLKGRSDSESLVDALEGLDQICDEASDSSHTNEYGRSDGTTVYYFPTTTYWTGGDFVPFESQVHTDGATRNHPSNDNIDEYIHYLTTPRTPQYDETTPSEQQQETNKQAQLGEEVKSILKDEAAVSLEALNADLAKLVEAEDEDEGSDDASRGGVSVAGGDMQSVCVSDEGSEENMDIKSCALRRCASEERLWQSWDDKEIEEESHRPGRGRRRNTF